MKRLQSARIISLVAIAGMLLSLMGMPALHAYAGLANRYVLKIAAKPPQGGTVSPGAGTHRYVKGQIVHLYYTAKPGYIFTGWSGDCKGPMAVRQ